MIDPDAGLFFGLHWGATRDDVGRHLPGGETVELAGIAWHVRPVFELECLTALIFDVADPAHLDGLGSAAVFDVAARWFGRPPERKDEGFFQVTTDATRLNLDLLDGRLTFEDAEL